MCDGCRLNQNRHFIFITAFSENHAVYNVEKYGTDRQATDDDVIRSMRFACWTTKATDAHTDIV